MVVLNVRPAFKNELMLGSLPGRPFEPSRVGGLTADPYDNSLVDRLARRFFYVEQLCIGHAYKVLHGS